MEEGIRKMDGQSLYKLGHALKGQSYNLGLDTFGLLGKSVEQAGNGGKLNACSAYTKLLSREYDRLEEFLASLLDDE